MINAAQIATHESPVWRPIADFLVLADLALSGMPGRWEQLWARALPEEEYQICCIPFFAYGLALGDIVRTRRRTEAEHVIADTVRLSGHTAVRIALEATDLRRAIVEQADHLNLPLEWHSDSYVAIDAQLGSAELAQLTDLLESERQTGRLHYELSREHAGE